jgi:hypothetical protein
VFHDLIVLVLLLLSWFDVFIGQRTVMWWWQFCYSSFFLNFCFVLWTFALYLLVQVRIVSFLSFCPSCDF